MTGSAFFVTFGLILVAEMGDKSQLAAVALAARYPWRRVLLGMGAAFIVLNLLAVGAGRLVFELAPLPWIRLASATLFILLGAFMWFGGASPSSMVEPGKRFPGAFRASFALIFLAELGDKTQIMTASLAAQESQLHVFAGSTLALVLAAGLGLVVGSRLSSVGAGAWIRRGGGLLFVLFGLLMAHQALS